MPTYIVLKEQNSSKGGFPYVPKKSAGPSGKGKGKSAAHYDESFEQEREWLLHKLESDTLAQDAKVADAMNEQEYEETGDGIECGCCFTTYAFVRLSRTFCLLPKVSNEMHFTGQDDSVPRYASVLLYMHAPVCRESLGIS